MSHARQGVTLAVEEANAEPGRRVALLRPELGNESEPIRAATARMITVNHVAALLGSSEPYQVDAIVSGLNAVSEGAKVPLVAGGGSRDGASEPFVFHVSVSPADRGRLLARFAARKFAGKKLDMIVHRGSKNSPAYDALAEAFAAEFAKEGGSVSRILSFANVGERKDAVSELIRDKPDVVFLAGNGIDVMRLERESLNKAIPIILAGPDGSLIAIRANPIDNTVYGVTAFLADQENPKVQAFAERYKARFHESPDVFAALAYDSARFLIRGIRATPGDDLAKLRAGLADIKQFSSVTGDFPMTKEHWLERNLYLVEIANGKLKRIETLDPAALRGSIK